MEEVWKPIEGYEGLYELSNLGRVRSYIPPNNSKCSVRNVPLYGYIWRYADEQEA